MAVADFHEALTSRLTKLDLAVNIWTRPVEIADPTADLGGWDRSALER